MSPIGRIFVVVNLALAMVFLGWASSSLANAHKFRSEKEAVEQELQATKTQLQEEIAGLTAARDEARRLQSQAIEQKAALDTQKKGLEQDIASLREEKATLSERVGSIDATLKAFGDREGDLVGKLKEATDDRVAAVNAKRDAESAQEKAEDAQRAAEAARVAAEKQIRDLQVQVASLDEELGRRDTLIEAYAQVSGLTVGEVGGQVPTIEAAVLGVVTQNDLSLVHLNMGKNDGVKRGYTFLVYNNATLKGRARVEVVNDATSTAVMIDTVDGRSPAQGDRATTRL